MSNNLVGNILELTVADPNVPAKPGVTWAKAIVWQGYAASSDRAHVKDKFGVTVFESWGNTELGPVAFNLASCHPIHDITVAELTSGKISVFLD